MQKSLNGDNMILETIIVIVDVLGISCFNASYSASVKSKKTKVMIYPMIVFIGTKVMMWALFSVSTATVIIYTKYYHV